jgi:hypothetical protein
LFVPSSSKSAARFDGSFGDEDALVEVHHLHLDIREVARLKGVIEDRGCVSQHLRAALVVV